MRMGVVPILLAAGLAGCTSQVDRELEAVKAARSALAEWALVEDQASKGRAQTIYVQQMRQLARDQLETAGSELAGQPAAARLIDRLRTGAPDADALKRANSALEPLEKQLESA